MKKLIFFLLSFMFSGFLVLNAQKDIVREDFFDAEFFLSEEEYNEALFSFQKVYKAGFQNNSNINYRIGVCYLNIPGKKYEAIPYLEKAVLSVSETYKEGVFTEVSSPPDAWLYLGNAYRINNQLDKAIDAYNSYLSLALKASPVDKEFALQQIESCKRAKESIKNPSPIFKENMGQRFNSNLNNFQAVYSGDENSMAYMTAQKFYDAVFFVKKVNGTWTNPINITPQIESDGNQYVSSLSFDGTKLFLVRIDNFDGDILISDYSMGRWNPSRSIGKTINTKYFESHASLSPDGKTLFFTSNRIGGLGGMDIYTSAIAENGEWSEPVNIGSTINTPLNEESPFVSSDGKTLYFSSQGHSTIGGYDVFTSDLQNNKTWSVPKPLPYPLNTTDDDLFFFPDNQKNGGYITLYEEAGLGEGDIYYMKIIPAEEALVADKPVETVGITEKPVENPVTTETLSVVEPVVVAEEKPTSLQYSIKPIFFGFDSFTLTDAAKEKLGDLTKAMQEYPLLSIEIRGYTDALGSFEYNQILSEKRAKAVTAYITSKGIDPSRLKIKGFSESENIAINAYADGKDALEGRKFNRRVEFHAIELGGALLIIEKVPVPEQLRVK